MPNGEELQKVLDDHSSLETPSEGKIPRAQIIQRHSSVQCGNYEIACGAGRCEDAHPPVP